MAGDRVTWADPVREATAQHRDDREPRIAVQRRAPVAVAPVRHGWHSRRVLAGRAADRASDARDVVCFSPSVVEERA